MEAGARGLNHPECGSLHDVMASEDHRGTVRTLRSVHCVHLANVGQSLGENLAWDLDSEVVVVLFGLLAAAVHQSSTVGYDSIYNLQTDKS